MFDADRPPVAPGSSMHACNQNCAPTASDATGDDESAGRTLNVLIVDDNPVNQALARRIVVKRGHTAKVAENGQKALDAVAEADFDIVLMDCQMPVMDGFEATRLIREGEAGTDRHLPVVAITAHAMVGDRERCIEAGMDDYLPKPIDPQQLRELLDGWAARAWAR